MSAAPLSGGKTAIAPTAWPRKARSGLRRNAQRAPSFALVLISIPDYETNSQSTLAAESLLSQDPARMAEA
jgi:hypothetical protein